MSLDLHDPSVGLSRDGLSAISGWDHVSQSLGDIFTTMFGERIMREWYGSLVPGLLGKLMTVSEVTPFFAAICAAIEQWEPRFRVVQIQVQKIDREGRFYFFIDGIYRPRAMLGDYTAEGAKRVTAYAGSGVIAVVGDAA